MQVSCQARWQAAVLHFLCVTVVVMFPSITSFSRHAPTPYHSHEPISNGSYLPAGDEAKLHPDFDEALPNTQLLSDYRVILPAGRWKIGTSSELVVYVFSLGSVWKKLRFGPYVNCSVSMCKGMPLVSHTQVCNSLCFTGKWRETDAILRQANAEFKRAMAKLEASISDMEALSKTHLHEGYDTYEPEVMALHDMLQSKKHSGNAVDILKPYREIMENMNKKFTNGQSSFSSDSIHKEVIYQIEDWRSDALQEAAILSVATAVVNGAQQRLAICSQGLVISDMTGCYPGLQDQAEPFTDTPLLNVVRSSYDGVVIVVRRTRFTLTKLSRWYMAFTDIGTGNETCWLQQVMVTDGTLDYTEPQCNPRGLCKVPSLADDVLADCEPDEDMSLGVFCPVVCGNHCFGPLCYRPETGIYEMRSPPGLRATPVSALPPRRVRKPICVTNPKLLSGPEVTHTKELVIKHAERVSKLLGRGTGTLDRLAQLEKKAVHLVAKLNRDNQWESVNMSKQKCDFLLSCSGWMSIGAIAMSLLSCFIAIWHIARNRNIHSFCSHSRTIPSNENKWRAL